MSDKDKRQLSAMLVALLFMFKTYYILQWVVSLSQFWMRALGSCLIILLLFAMVITVICIQEPKAFKEAYRKHKQNRFFKQFNRRRESDLSRSEINTVRKKYPGLF